MSRDRILQIFDAAAEVFAETGFDRARIDDIAQRAGVAKGTIYYHFRGKDELFSALMTEFIRRLQEQCDRHGTPTGDPVEDLKRRVEAMARFLLANRRFAVMLLSEAWGSERRQHAFRSQIRTIVRAIEEVLHRGLQVGAFKARDAGVAAAGIFGSITVTALYTALIDRAPDDDTVARQIAEQVLSGVLPGR